MKKNSGGGGGGDGDGRSPNAKPDRKTIEKNRRIHMKSLCFKLASLIPRHHFNNCKEIVSQQDQLGIAAAYIKHMRERIEKLEERKENLRKSMVAEEEKGGGGGGRASGGLGLPVVELRDMGSSIEVVLISGLNKNFLLYEAITILEQEGAEVVSASFCTVGGKIFHTLHAQVRISRVGVETSRVCQRLQDLITYY